VYIRYILHIDIELTTVLFRILSHWTHIIEFSVLHTNTFFVSVLFFLFDFISKILKFNFVYVFAWCVCVCVWNVIYRHVWFVLQEVDLIKRCQERMRNTVERANVQLGYTIF